MARSQATASRRLGWAYATDYRNRGRVRHLVAVRPDRESDPDVDAGSAGVRGRRGHPAGQTHPVGLRGGIAAARCPRLRPEPVGRSAAGGGRRRGRRGQHDPDQRRAAVRRPRPPGVLGARVHRPAGRGDLGQGRRAGDGGRRAPRRERARRREAAALQEQRGRQGRVVRVARELPDVAPDAVLGGDRGPDAVSGVPPGDHRLRPGRHRPVGRRAGLPAVAALRLHRGRGRPGDHAQARHHQHPRRAARRRRQVPAAARHHRRREPRRDVDLSQARRHVAGAGPDRRGHGPHRPGAGPAGARRACRSAATRRCAPPSRWPTAAS